MAPCTALKRLTTTSWDCATGDGIRACTVTMVSLRAENPTDEDLENLAAATAMPFLCLTVEYDGGDAAGDHTLELLADACAATGANLTGLALSHCYGVTDVGMVALEPINRSLQSLDIDFLPNITNAGILAACRGPHMRSLSLCELSMGVTEDVLTAPELDKVKVTMSGDWWGGYMAAAEPGSEFYRPDLYNYGGSE